MPIRRSVKARGSKHTETSTSVIMLLLSRVVPRQFVIFQISLKHDISGLLNSKHLIWRPANIARPLQGHKVVEMRCNPKWICKASFMGCTPTRPTSPSTRAPIRSTRVCPSMAFSLEMCIPWEVPANRLSTRAVDGLPRATQDSLASRIVGASKSSR